MTTPFRPLHPRALPALLVLLLLACSWLTASAQAAKRSFDIPAGRAEVTLKAFADQAGTQFFFSAEKVGGVRTAPVKGEFAAREALDWMLKDSGLVAVQDKKTGALSVRRDDSPNAPRAAQNSDRPSDQSKVEDGRLVLDKFEVFGTKSINLDLPRTRDDAQPYVVFSREQLQASPAANLEEFFRARLPMNQTFSSNTAGAGGANSLINLRGLGTNQTLILLDGRRLPPSAFGGGGVGQADINGIPLGMIERIEVLPVTASGIYGGSATGGVINIITRKDYAGVEVGATYQNTFDTDAATRRFELNGSLKLEGGHTMLTLNFSRTDANALLMQDRDFATRSRALFLQNNPAAMASVTIPPAGYLANIRSSTGANLVLKSGTALNSPITFVPVGYAGPTSDGGAALVANAGRYDLNMPRANFGALKSLLSVPTTEAFGIGLRRRFGSRVEAYADASRLKNDSLGALAFQSSTTLATNAPNNPFTSAITVNFPNLAPVLPIITGSRSDRLVAGVMVRLPAEWSAGGDFVLARSRTDSRLPLSQLGDPDGTGPGISYTTALSTGVLNVLRDLYAVPLDLGPYLMPTPYSNSSFELTSWEWALRGSGPLAKLPAGPLVLSASVQWREERNADAVSSNASTASPTPTYTWDPAVGAKARAYYGELHLPILGGKSQIPLARSLEFQASVRRDEFTARSRENRIAISVPSPGGPFPAVTLVSRHFQATKATVGLKLVVSDDLALRASYGTGFLPPTLPQLSPLASATNAVTIIDPRRGNSSQIISPVRLQGGSPDIGPEESKSTSVGLVFTPRFASALRLSVDYTRIVKTNEIGSLAIQNLLDQEALFPTRVVRAPLTTQDQALGYTGGVITQINLRNLNLSGRRLEACDMQADYTWKPAGWGEFQAYAIATWQPHMETQALVTAPWVETVGYNLGSLEWRGNGGLTWTRGPWTLGWNTQYSSSYYVYTATSTAAARTTAVLNQGAATIPSQVYHDLSASYRWGAQSGGWRRLFASCQLTVGVQNIFDTSPPILADLSPYSSTFPYSLLGDPRLRRYTISLRKKL